MIIKMNGLQQINNQMLGNKAFMGGLIDCPLTLLRL